MEGWRRLATDEARVTKNVEVLQNESQSLSHKKKEMHFRWIMVAYVGRRALISMSRLASKRQMQLGIDQC